MIDFVSTNPVIMSFPPFAGGKFISNCLSLSRHACPQDLEAACHLLFRADDYDFRLTKVLQSLPVPEEVRYWRRYEFGDTNLYGESFLSWIQQGQHVPGAHDYVIGELSRSSMRFFIVDHCGPPQLTNLLAVWPNATIVRIINSEQFQALAVAVKSDIINIVEQSGNYSRPKYQELAGPDWPCWHDFERSGYDVSQFPDLDVVIVDEIQKLYPWKNIARSVLLFDMDASIFEKSCFERNIQMLYTQLGFDDFDSGMIGMFYDAYIKLHPMDNLLKKV